VPTDQSRGDADAGDDPRAMDDATQDATQDVTTRASDAGAADEGEVSHLAADVTDAAESADTAAASALARAREAARARGLRPGSRPMRRRNPNVPSGSALTGSQGSGRDGRDPSLLGDQMDRLLLDRGWNVDVAIGSVMGRWPAIVGAEVAAHCTPVTFSDGVLTVRAESTAWATQLRLMSSSILGRLETEVGKDAVTELRVHGPSAPSWSRGLRKSTGPGPRDTYG
jgi:predicted nucleic acid-binding Zn ribbon protein